jgi:LCP family protein required for cell wall assembly
VAGFFGLVLFFLLLGAAVALVVLGITNPGSFATLVTSSSQLLSLMIVLGVVGSLYVLFSIRAWVRMRRDVHFHRSRLGAFVLGASLVAQVGVFGGTEFLTAQQYTLVSTLLATPNSAATAVADSDKGGSVLDSAPELHGSINVLLLGGDAGENRWMLRPDSLSVAHINLDTGEVVMVGIPRNLQKARFVEGSPMRKVFPNGYDCGNTCLINAIYVYAIGHPSLFSDSKYDGKDIGVAATRDAVEGVTGLKIDYYVLIDMKGFRRLVNAVGGVTVCVPERFVTQFGHVFEPGCQHMDGKTALLYARTRKDSSDYVRMTRQRLVQKSLLQQVNGIKLLKAYSEVAKNGSQYITTDIPQDVAAGLLRAGVRAANAPFSSVELVPPTISTVDPNFTQIHKMVADAVAGK